jgi:hypothetical protein|tara:strand:+ start:11598 stop:11762 length:165 start_codon:yes stop_codon:yes gene_type:complete
MKEVQVKHIITPELIKSLYEKARTLPPAEAKKLIDQCKLFSAHIGEYLVKKIDE